ncbi:MAG: T9SS type A sorting domain-containing protein [Ekhidna sp.]|nr:T9SS type A sorting domain-containing protein [Ekhidna sp.]
METILTIANATYNTATNVAILEFSDNVQINGNLNTVSGYFTFTDRSGTTGVGIKTIMPTAIADGTAGDNMLQITIDLGDDPTDRADGALGDVEITYTDPDDTDGINISTTASPAVELLNIAAGSGPLLDLDNTPPTITSVAAGGTTQITVTFSEPVQPSTIVATDFTVVDGLGNTFAVSAWADGTVADTNITLTVADFSGAVGDLRVTYTRSLSVIEDFGRNSTASGQSAVIDRDVRTPTFDSFTVNDMNTIAMHFSEEVQTNGISLTDFTVGDITRRGKYKVFTQSAAGSTVVLTTADLSSAVDTLFVTYTNNSGEIRDYGENAVATTTNFRDLPGTPMLVKNVPTTSEAFFAIGDPPNPAPPTPPSLAVFRTTDDMNNPGTHGTVTITPTIDQSTIRIYSDPSLPQGDASLYWEMDNVSSTIGIDVSVNNILSSLPDSEEPDFTDRTHDNGIYTFYITEQTDIAAHGVAREGPAATYSLAFLDDIIRRIPGSTPNEATTFSVDQEDIEVNISLYHPADQILNFTGGGLRGSVVNPGRGDTSRIEFSVGSATIGSNQTSITWSNASSERAIFEPSELAFNITGQENVFDPMAGPSQDRKNRSFAKSDMTTSRLELNTSLGSFDSDGTDTMKEDFYIIEAYFIRNGVPVTMDNDGMVIGVSGVAFPTGGNIASNILVYDSPGSTGGDNRADIDALNNVNNTVSTYIAGEWEIDPDGLPANIAGLFPDYNNRIDTIRLYTIWRDDNDPPSYGQISSADIYLYPDPGVTVSLLGLGRDGFYCEDDRNEAQVRANISTYAGYNPTNIPGIGTNGSNIRNGYLLEYSAGGSTSFATTERVNFSDEVINGAPAGTSNINTFSIQDPLGDGSNARGIFRIIYQSLALTDADIIVQDTLVFEVRPKASAPRIDLAELGNYGGFNDRDSSYVFEFCEGDMIPNIVINTMQTPADAVGSEPNASYNWYQSSDDLLFESETNTLDPTLIFPTGTVSGTVEKDIYVTRTVDGCESGSVQISFRVFAIPDAVEVSAPDTNPNINASGGEYYFEYCWDPIGADVAYDATEILSSLNDVNSRAYIQDRSYFAIWDGESAADPIAIIRWNNSNDYEIADLSATPYTAPVSGTTVASNGINSEVFWISEVVADSTLVNPAAVFEGCEGERARINAIIYTDPAIPRAFTGNPRFDSDGAEDIYTYYMCANETFPDVGIDPPAGLVNDYTFQWSDSDTFSDTLTIGNRRGEVVTQVDLSERGNPGGFNPGMSGIYTYYVRIVTNRNLNSGYLGCESAPQRVDIVVYPTSDVPTISVNNVADRESDGGSQLRSTISTGIGSFDVEYNFCVDGSTDEIVGGLDAGILFRSTINFDQNNPAPRTGSPNEDNEVLWFVANPDASGVENDNAVASTLGLTVDTLSAVSLQMDGTENATFNFAVLHRENFIDGYTFFDGCFSSVEDNTVYVRVNVNTVPVPQFTWTGITEDQPTVFNFIDQTSVGTPVNYNFNVYPVNGDGTRGASLVSNVSTTAVDLNASRSEFTATFADAGVYEAELQINSEAGCSAVEVRRFRILEHIDFPTLDVRSYQQFFETGDGGWFVEFQGDDGLSGSYEVTSPRVSTWVHGVPDGAIINGTSDGSGQAWSTTGTYNPASTIENTYVGGEDSWVYSPSFDFSNIANPAIQFETYRDLELKDGVTFQYSTDNGTNWITLGEFEPTLDGTSPSSGTNWFNARQISSSVGQAAVVNETPENVNREGWSGQYDADEQASSTNGWLVSTHELVRIPDKTNVRFRFALSSQGTPEEAKLGNGFGFDNMRIFNLEKSVLVEQFSSSIDNNAIRLDTTAQLFARGRLYINYFTSLSNTEDRIDLLNMRNPSGPAQRRLYYGIGDLGTSALDGEVIAKASSTSPGWNNVDVSIKELVIPELLLLATDNSFGLVSNDSEPNTISVSATWRFQVSGDDGSALTLEDQDYSFYFAVIEEAISVTNITTEGGENNYADMGIDSIYNVFRTFMPNADGDPFTNYRGSVTTGQEFNVDAEWEISSVFDVSKLRVIAFAQNNNTQTIIQSGELDITGKASLVTGLENELFGFELYPNPANNGFTVEFAMPITAETAWVLLDQTGRETASGAISEGSRRTNVSTKDVPSGLYFIHIYGGDGKPQSKRVIVVH